MLKFSQLTLSQKRFVVSVIEAHPHYKKDPAITLKECAAIYYALRDTRTGAKNEKVGYPNWLFNKNKIERGVYQLPIPTEAELSAYQLELNAKLNPVATAKTKVAKLAKAKVVKVKQKSAQTPAVSDRLADAIDASESDADVEEFNQILRDNGIEV